MLFLLASWAILLAVTLPLGLAILRWTGAEPFDRLGDRLALAVWLGLVALGSALLALAFLTPLSPAAGAALGLGCAGAALCSAGVRRELHAAIARLSPGLACAALGLAAGCAVAASQPVVLFDMGEYHVTSIRWLSDFGAVEGIGLLHNRFGFDSSWFALAAPFGHGGLRTHAGSMLGGFAMLLLVAQALLCAGRLLQRRARPADWLLLAGAALLIPVQIGSQKLQVSTSPDLPLNILVLLAGWALVCVAAARSAGAGAVGRLSPGPAAVPLILACGATAMKPLAGPAIVVAGLYYLADGGNPLSVDRRWLRRLGFGVAIGLLLLGPWVAYEFVTTGCPAFPLPACFDVPWSVGSGQASSAATLVAGSRFRGEGPSGGLSWVDGWIGDDLSLWLGSVAVAAAMLAAAGLALRRLAAPGSGAWRLAGWLLLAGAAGAYVFLLRAEEIGMVVLTAATVLTVAWRAPTARWLAALGLAGMALIFYEAPDPRFSLGFEGVMLGRLAVYLPAAARSWLGHVVPLRRLPSARLATVLALGALVAALLPLARPTTTRSDVVDRFSLAVPPSMPAPALVDTRFNGIDYHLPVFGDCWAAALPCAPEQPHADVVLRDPERGIAGGFERSGG